MKCVIDIETTGLNPLYNKIIVFGIKRIDKGNKKSLKKSLKQYKEWEIGEKEVIKSILQELKKAKFVIGYNIRKFDLPFILERVRLLKMGQIKEIEKIVKNIKIVDIFDYFGYGSLQRWANQYKISLILPNIKGFHMPYFYFKKDFEKIEKHNADDILVCEKLLRIIKNY